MKILKAGGTKKVWTKKVTCTGAGNGNSGGCGAKLLVAEGDLYSTYRSDLHGNNLRTYITFTCPCCQTKTDINAPCSVKVFSSEDEYLRSKENEEIK